ncbi:MAG: hypothetical protein JOZ68_17445 [Acidimicrobiia bacterium]|nr:hypothetical protein [Acidimicrobiia bacterium]
MAGAGALAVLALTTAAAGAPARGAPGSWEFAANTGRLLFVDHSFTHHVDHARDVVTNAFVDPKLDDLAPQTGSGAKPTPHNNVMLLAVVGGVVAAVLLAVGIGLVRVWRRR